MKRASITVLFCLFGGVLFSQSSGEPLDWGARSQAMGNAAVMLDGTWSIFQNQAGLASVDRISAGAFYMSRYNLDELSTGGLGVALPAAGGTFGLAYVSYGYTAYREQRVGLSYARQLGEKLDVGVQLDYIGVSLGGQYGSTAAFTFEGGAIYRASEEITLAVHVFNPTRVKLAEFNDERLPAVLRFGGMYRFSDRVALTGEIRKHIEYDPSVAVGLEYEVVTDLYVRGGVAGAPSRFSFGAGYRFKAFQIDVSAAVVETIGYTPQVSLTYNGQ